MTYSFSVPAGSALNRTVPTTIAVTGYTLTVQFSKNSSFKNILFSKAVTGTGKAVTVSLTAGEATTVGDSYYRIRAVNGAVTEYIQSGKVDYVQQPIESAPSVPPTRSSRRLYAIAIGDSTTAGDLRDLDGHLTDTGGLSVHMEPRIQANGPRSWFTHLCMLSGGRLVHLYNAGRGSERTPEMLSRFQQFVVAYKPDVVFLGDARNDMGVIDPSVTKANIRSMINQALAAGILPIITTCYPDNSAGVATALRKHNAWLKKIAEEYRIPLSDKYAAVVDPANANGTWLAANTLDGTHASYPGAILAAKRVLKDIENLLAGTTEWLPTDRVKDINLLTNPLFQTGSPLATSWTTAGTVTNSQTTDAAILGNIQTTQWTVSGTGRLTQDINAAGNFAVGDRLRWAGLVKSVAVAGSLRWALEFSIPGGGTYAPRAIDYSIGLELLDWNYFEIDMIVPAGATTVRPGVQVLSGTGSVSLAQQGVYNLTSLTG